MATLADTLRQQRQGITTRDASGTLSTETPEEIGTLANKAGLQAPPTTPIGGAMIGANANQQKMMGTPQQKQAVFNANAQAPDSTLQNALRRQQVRTQASAPEQQEKQKSEDMQNLGSLGDRVTDFINAQRQNLEGQAGQGVAVANASSIDLGNGAQDLTPYASDIAALRNNPSDMNAQLKVNQDLGLNVNNTLSADQINNLYESSNQSLATGGANTVSDSLSVNDLVNSGKFGYDMNSLSGLLGVPADQLQGMTVGALKNKIDQVTQDEFTHSQQLQQQSQSGQLGQAERGLAQQQGQEASRTGLRASEADMNSLVNQIQNSDQVSFGGKNYNVDDLLKDSTVSGIITDYLNAAPGSPDRAQLEKTEPQLIDFINKNQAVLADAATKISGGAQQFGNLQQQNKKTATLGGALSDDVASKLIPNYGQLSATAIDPSKIPVLAVAQSLTPDQTRTYGANISNLTSIPGAANELVQLTPNEISQLQLDSTSPSAPYQQYTQNVQRYQQIQGARSIDQLTPLLFSQGTPPNLAQDVKQNAAMNALGLGGDPSLSVLDPNGTGQIDSVDNIKQRMASQAPSLLDTIHGKNTVSGASNYKGLNIPTMPTDPAKQSLLYTDPNSDAVKASLFNRMGGAASDGKIDVQDINSNYGNASNVASVSNSDRIGRLNELTLLSKSPNLDQGTKDQIKASVSYMQDLNARSTVNDMTSNYGRLVSQNGQKAALEATIPQLQSLLSGSQTDTNYGQSKSTINNLLNTLQSQLNSVNSSAADAQQQSLAQAMRNNYTVSDHPGNNK